MTPTRSMIQPRRPTRLQVWLKGTAQATTAIPEVSARVIAEIAELVA
jgi:hypothetical protein